MYLDLESYLYDYFTKIRMSERSVLINFTRRPVSTLTFMLAMVKLNVFHSSFTITRFPHLKNRAGHVKYQL